LVLVSFFFIGHLELPARTAAPTELGMPLAEQGKAPGQQVACAGPDYPAVFRVVFGLRKHRESQDKFQVFSVEKMCRALA